MTEKELKPCPFCGDTVVKQTDLDGRLKIWCRAHTHIGFTLTQDHKQSIRKWNNAYCWKELSQAKKEAEEWKQWAERLAEYAFSSFSGDGKQILSDFQKFKGGQKTEPQMILPNGSLPSPTQENVSLCCLSCGSPYPWHQQFCLKEKQG